MESFLIPVKVFPIAGKIQELSAEAFAAIGQNKPIWLITACLSLHHMPREVKIPTLP